jgi:hypothetical protein
VVNLTIAYLTATFGSMTTELPTAWTYRYPTYSDPPILRPQVVYAHTQRRAYELVSVVDEQKVYVWPATGAEIAAHREHMIGNFRNDAFLRKLIEKIEEWGGHVTLIEKWEHRDEFYTRGSILRRDYFPGGWSEAPFGSGVAIHHATKHLLINSCIQDTASLIHETGHLFATTRTPDQETEEITWLAWEWKLAQELGIEDEWRLNCDTYGLHRTIGALTNLEDFGDLTYDNQTYALETLSSEYWEQGLDPIRPVR